jgi:chromosome segregation ATPase
MLAESTEPHSLCESLGQLRSVCHGLDDFMRGLFDDLRGMYDDLDRRRGDLDGARRQLETEGKQLDVQRQQLAEQRIGLDEQRQQLADATQRLCDAKRDLEHQRGQSAASADAELTKFVEQLQSERDRLQSELDAAVAQSRQFAGAACDTAALQVELAQARTETANLQTVLAQAKAEIVSVRSDFSAAQAAADVLAAESLAHKQRVAELTDELATAREDLAHAEAAPSQNQSAEAESLQKEIHDLINERSVVELQLEVVRERAAELTERLEEQDRQFASERKRWQAEIGEMTRLLTLSSRYAGGAQVELPAAAAVATAPKASAADEPAEAPASANPVVDSVMAQFRAVQKEAAKRRVATK